LHETERWRDALIADDEAQTRWAGEYPDCDLQRLRSLVRAARRDQASRAEDARQPRSYRDLFQFLRPWITENET
jgi:ribosome-associated protein